MAIEVEVNGEKRAVQGDATIAALLAELGVAAERIAVERNGRIVRRGEHATTRVAAGDRIEIVTLVGGG
jgi:thiamine biosynthesis protein ThiS